MCHLVDERNHKQATASDSGHMMMEIYRMIRVYKAGGSCLPLQWSSEKNDSEGSSISAEVWRTSGKEDILYVKSQWTVWTRVWRGRLRQVIHDYTWSLISGVNSLKDTVVRSETRNVRIGCVICERLWNPQLWKSDFLLIVSEFSCVWKIIARSKFEGK